MFGITFALRRIKNGILAGFAAAAFALALFAAQAVVFTHNAAAQTNAAANMTLLAEIQKSSPDLAIVVQALDANADPDVADSDGVAALIIAATLGHAEIVSVLVTAGADANARWDIENPGRAVPHVAAINNFGVTLHYPWKTALNVLRHFADAVNQAGAIYDWDSNGGGSHRAVEYLHYRYNHTGAVWGGNARWPAESDAEKYEAMEEMTDILLENGDDCRPHPDRTGHITCQGSLRAALAEVVIAGASADEVRAAAQTVAAAGIRPDARDRSGSHAVALAAQKGFPELVSILVTFGLDPGGTYAAPNNRGVLHLVGRNSDVSAPLQLRILRHWIGGLRVAGKLDAFFGWNDKVNIGGPRGPLEALQVYAPKPTDAAAREIQKLLWEGGSRCETPAGLTYCQVPRESRFAAAYSAGDGLTVRGRDFRGTVFVYSAPSAELNVSLAALGWRATLESSGEEFVILRTRQQSSLDASAAFTVTARARGDVVRLYDVEAAVATVGLTYATVPNDGSLGVLAAGGEGLIGTDAVYAGSRITFTATSEPGHGVFAWTGDGVDCPQRALTCAVRATPGSDVAVTARFVRTYPAGYAEIPDDKRGGTLTAEGLTGEDIVFSGVTATFRASPTPGWFISAWEGDVGSCAAPDLECVLTADNNLFVTVRFEEGRLVEYQEHPLDKSGGTLTASGLAGDNVARDGARVTFTASPAYGWDLAAWEGDVGDCTALDLECVLTASADLRVTARFLPMPPVDLTLRDEIVKTSPNLGVALQALRDGADPDLRVGGIPALIVAATLGHARIVAALVTAGAGVGAADPNFHNADVVQHMAAPLTSPAVKDRAARATVLHHFGAALYARNAADGDATFDWNRPDDRGNRALDLLVMAEDADLSAMPALQARESVSVIYQMSDYMLARGAACGDATTDKMRRVCAGLACAAGETTHDGACVELDAALIAEVQKSSPDLFVVGALLDDGANANLTLAGGAPLVIAALTLNHVKVMGMLITAGANPFATHEFRAGFRANIPEYLARDLPGGYFDAFLRWGRAATIVAGSPTLDWSSAGGNSDNVFANLSDSHTSAVGERANIRALGGYVLDLGAACPSSVLNDNAVRAICTSRHACASARDSLVYACSACSGAPLLIGGACVSEEKQCADAGWSYSSADDSCGVLLTLAGGAVSDKCHFSGESEPQCAAVFGAELNFFSPTIEAGATLRLVYNCDPEKQTGFLPSTLANGATECACPAGKHAHDGICAVPNEGLAAEMRKPSPNTDAVRGLLGAGADADLKVGGIPALIVAATAGHAEIVSVLVTFGADADARDSDENAVPHITAINDFGSAPLHYSWGTALNVLRHFADAVNQSGATYDWTSTRINGLRAVEVLEYRYSATAAVWDGESDAEKYEAMEAMADILLAEGDFCLPGRSWASHVTCQGGLRKAVADAALSGAGAGEMRVKMQAVVDAGISLDIRALGGGDSGGHIVGAAAAAGNAEAVSVLVTFGVDPGGKTANNRTALHYVAQNSEFSATTQLRVLRHFLGGLEVAGAEDSFDGWNDASGPGRPLDVLQSSAPRPPTAALTEIQGLLYERGARCAAPGVIYCKIPVETLTLPSVAADFTGGAVTMTAGDFWRGAALDFVPPAEVVAADLQSQETQSARLESIGWRVETEANPARAILNRTRAADPGDPAVFPGVTVTAWRNGVASRVFQILDPSQASGDDLQVVIDLSGSGRYSLMVNGSPAAPGDSVPFDADVEISVFADSGHMIAGWGGVCAGTPSGAGRTAESCAFSVNTEDVVVSVIVIPALPHGLPVSGDVPDRRSQYILGERQINYFCKLLGGNPSTRPGIDGHAVLVCEVYGALNHQTCDINAGFAYLDRCGPGLYREIRDCNLRNERGVSPGVCAACPAGTVARGKSCVPLSDYADQCDASPCDPDVSCFDPRLLHANPLENICACKAGLSKDGAVCADSVATAELLAEVGKASGEASATLVRTLVDEDNANPHHVDRLGRGLLMLAARNGHPEVVSVLVTLGADVNEVDSYYRFNVAHHMATRLDDPAPGPRALRASMLYHFGAALDVRNARFGDADFDWNQGDQSGQRALDLLVNATAPSKLTLEGEDLAVMHEMADYLIGRGASCGHKTANHAQRICTGNAGIASARASLVAEVEKPVGQASAAEVLRLLDALDEDGAEDLADSNGRPLLIIAARMGHAEIVSVLVTAGADPNGRDAGFYDLNVVHHMATPFTDPAAGPRALRASVLYHFGAALDVRNTMFGDANFDWNREDRNSYRALDILARAEAGTPRPAAENATIIYEMASYMVAKGARCGYRTANHLRSVCTGRGGVEGLLFVEAVKDGDADKLRAAAQTAVDAGVDLDSFASDGNHMAPLAAQLGHAEAVSILVTFGLNPRGRLRSGYEIPHLVGSNSAGGGAPLQLRILRHFIGGLGAAGKVNSVDLNLWNRAADPIGRPLDALPAYAGEGQPHPEERREIYELMYERGARCASPGDKTYCQPPSEGVSVPSPSGTGGVVTIAAPDFGGTDFFLLPVNAETRATLAARGWRMDYYSGPPARAVLARTRAASGFVDRLPSLLTVRALHRGQIAREFLLSGERPQLFVESVGSGSVTVLADGQPVQSGDQVGAYARVEIIAAPAAGWTLAAWGGAGNCVAPDLKCALTVNAEVRVTAFFGQNCAVYNRHPGNSGCGECLNSYKGLNGPEGLCVKDDGDFGLIPQSELCLALQGGGEDARLEGGGKVCSGVDANDTFCILDSVDGFPCRGLFRHVLRCNIGFARKALNPFFCGERCGDREYAVGSECVKQDE